MLAPVIEEIAEEYGDKIKIGKVNVDEEAALSIKFGVMSIPTVILFENGEVKESAIGYRPKEELVQIFLQNTSCTSSIYIAVPPISESSVLCLHLCTATTKAIEINSGIPCAPVNIDIPFRQ